MFTYTLFIQVILITGVNSAVIERNKRDKNSEEFGSSENFLNSKVDIPNVHGSGKVYEISRKTNIAEHSSNELDRLLREIYDNFVVSDKSTSKGDSQLPTTTTTTTSTSIDFKDLEHAVDDLIKALSKEPDNQKKTVDDNVTNKYPSFHDYELKKDVSVDDTANKKMVGMDSNGNLDKQEKMSYSEFKKKFQEVFLDGSTEQRLPFGGKKETVEVDNQSSIDEKLSSKSLSELYTELKKEVQIEKEILEKKVALNTVENKPVKKEETTSSEESKIKNIEEKKKEIISLLDTFIKEQKSVFNGKKKDEMKNNVDDDKSYKTSPQKDAEKTAALNDKKNVEEVFLNAFKTGLKENDDRMKIVNNYIDKQKKETEENNVKTVNNYIESQKKEVKKETHENMKKEEKVSDEEKLRKTLVDLIDVLDNSLKKNIGKTHEEQSSQKMIASDAAKYEDELETVAQKKESEKSIDNMIELLKGFDIDINKHSENEGKNRP